MLNPLITQKAADSLGFVLRKELIDWIDSQKGKFVNVNNGFITRIFIIRLITLNGNIFIIFIDKNDFCDKTWHILMMSFLEVSTWRDYWRWKWGHVHPIRVYFIQYQKFQHRYFNKYLTISFLVMSIKINIKIRKFCSIISFLNREFRIVLEFHLKVRI